MTESNSTHLNEDELNSWLETPGSEQLPKAEHVRDCPQCELLVATAREHEARLRKLRNKGDATPRRDCPSPETWARLTAGLIAEPQAQGLLEHAAGCDACGEELRVATVCFDDDTEAETQPIVGLQASTPSWKKNMAAELAMRSSRVRRFPSRYMAIAAGIVLAMVGGTSTWWMMRTSSTDATASLLAQAYDSRPPFEYRIPGAQPGKPSPQRGSEESVKDRPLALLEAEARIQKEMSRPSPGIQWVSFMARADLLEGNYDEAIVSLLSLHEAKPNDTGVLAELGRAYAIRATQRTDHRQDIDSAVEYLNRALQIRPRDPETLFNLALLYTEIQQYSNAEETWRRYLAVDSTSAWAEEARSHLLEVQKKK